MEMTFWSGSEVVILFDSWSVTTPAGYVCSLGVVVLMGLVHQIVIALRRLVLKDLTLVWAHQPLPPGSQPLLGGKKGEDDGDMRRGSLQMSERRGSSVREGRRGDGAAAIVLDVPGAAPPFSGRECKCPPGDEEKGHEKAPGSGSTGGPGAAGGAERTGVRVDRGESVGSDSAGSAARRRTNASYGSVMSVRDAVALSEKPFESLSSRPRYAILPPALRTPFYARSADALLFMIALGLSYLVMFVAMTYNVGLFFATLVGEALGHYFFSQWGHPTANTPAAATSVPTAEVEIAGEDCCQT